MTAPVVFVNYGSPADYEELEKMGISVSGAIALARYGLTWRGIKPKVAAEHGAVGCLIIPTRMKTVTFKAMSIRRAPCGRRSGRSAAA